MRTLREQPMVAAPLALNRAGTLAFHDVDHGDGRAAERGGSLGWLEDLLAESNITDADGEIWLQCYPRVMGYTFKPVSFWYCLRASGELRAVVVEVNNTFGERHAYLLDRVQFGLEIQAQKQFHVSPFCSVQGNYRFRFPAHARAERQALQVNIEFDDPSGALLRTCMMGRLSLLDAKAKSRALWQYPLMTLGVIARIHWHALLLWCKGAPFHRKPSPPINAVSRTSPNQAGL